jgi:hypothetical protein
MRFVARRLERSTAPASAKGTGQPSRSGLLLRELGPSAVPQREGEAKSCLLITNAHQAVLTQPICARTGVIVWRVFPCRALLAVILAHRAPLPIQVGTRVTQVLWKPQKIQLAIPHSSLPHPSASLCFPIESDAPCLPPQNRVHRGIGRPLASFGL